MRRSSANRLYGRRLKHRDLPLYGVVHGAVIALVRGREHVSLEQISTPVC